MDITQQQYIIALAEAKSITKAAKLLHVSQPALSSWLDSIERQLGTKLVIRSKKELIFTPAGQIYLDGARKMVQIKHKTYAEMASVAGYLKKTLTVSGTPNGGAELFANIFSQFRERYPAVSLQFLESYNKKTFELVANGTADFGIGSLLDMDSPSFECLFIDEDELILLLPSNHRLSYDASKLKYDAELPYIDLSQLTDLPFIMPSPEMSYYDGLMEIFERIHFHPTVLFQSANVKVLYQMVKSANGAAILPRRLFSPLDPVAPFSLKPKFTKFSTIIYKKGRRLDDAQQYLLELFAHRSSPHL